MSSYSGKRVTVMGLGHFGGGAAAARWLARQGARVTVTDRADLRNLADALRSLEGLPIEAFHLGGHREDDFRHADCVVVNPAVRPDNRFVQIARDANVPLTTEIGLFSEACPGSVIGVTGTNGKSTTSAMIAHLLADFFADTFAHDGRRAWLGGNLGGSLLDELERIHADDWAVLELSSFQLEHLSATTAMPRVAVVTNCVPNHLDWHGDFSNYTAAKQRLLRDLPPDGRVVLGPSLADDPAWISLAGERRVELIDQRRVGSLPLPGRHNRENAVCALTAAMAAGCAEKIFDGGFDTFSGLPGRMERVATIARRTFYNDTTATTPESTIAALASLAEPIWLLAGGGDKGVDMDELTAMIVRSACGAAFYGMMGPTLYKAVGGRSAEFRCVCRETMAEAFEWCWRRSRPGDAIVLSPACSSHDQFQNFRHRGDAFVDLVASLAARQRGADGFLLTKNDETL